MSLNTKQRRQQIMSQLYEHGYVEVKGLATLMVISEATVRRDLRALQGESQLELVYGGATLPRVSDHSFRSRAQRNIEAKRAIGRLAADLVHDNDHLYIDSGTTCFEVAPHLRRRRGLSVIVNSTRLATELGQNPDLSVILIGGHYRPDRMEMIGPLASATIDQLRGYLAFIGGDGLSMQFGVAAADVETANLYRQIIQHARETVLLADHTKFMNPSLFKVCNWDAISRVVTDQQPLPEWEEFLNAQGIDVVYPEMSAGNGHAVNPVDE